MNNRAEGSGAPRAGRFNQGGLLDDYMVDYMSEAFQARKENKSGIYSYEQRSVDLPAPYDGLFKQHAAAWDFFQAQPASYRKQVSWWIVSAKQEETRQRRLERLVAHSARGERLPEAAPRKPAR